MYEPPPEDKCGFVEPQMLWANPRFERCSDKEMIDELKGRGYGVVKRGLLMDIYTTHCETVPSTHPSLQSQSYKSWLVRHLCLGFAGVLVRPGIVKFTERPFGPDGKEHRAELVVVAHTRTP